jgi:rfaE bifunctional protein nucleotidyltransferase chain/domain
MSPVTQKPLKFSQVESFCEDVRKANKKIVFTNGCFDILHLGHVSYLNEARALGDFLFVGINNDSSVTKLKGEGRPVQNEYDRAVILQSLRSVDVTCLFGEPTPLELIKLVRPDILVKGGDWTVDKIVGGDWVTSRGGKCLSLPFFKGHSTSLILEKIKKL